VAKPVNCCRFISASHLRKDKIIERHRHRYEVNNILLPQIEAAGMKVSGRCVNSNLVEMIELPDHPWFVGCQFHPNSHPHRVMDILYLRDLFVRKRISGET